jgi:hypothetical protein
VEVTEFAPIILHVQVSPVGISLGTPSYNQATNTLTQPIVFAKGKYPHVENLLVLAFNQTKATPTSAVGTGFKGMQILRPGYSPSGHGTQLFTDNWAQLLKIFDHTRWMGTTGHRR